jgi:DNA polymerase I-like protein with 3'-5' exonuclease and polymerase domains
MNSPRSTTQYFALCLFTLLAAACTSQMQPAQQALDAIGDTIASAKDAPKYVPDQVTSVQNHLAELKASFAKQDYGAVLDHAPAVLDEANALEGAATAKRDQLRATMLTDYRALSASMPQLMDSVKTRLETLLKSGRAPKGVDLAAATSDFNDASAKWTSAQAVYKSGTIEDALEAAKAAKDKVEAVATALKMDLPKAAG